MITLSLGAGLDPFVVGYMEERIKQLFPHMDSCDFPASVRDGFCLCERARLLQMLALIEGKMKEDGNVNV